MDNSLTKNIRPILLIVMTIAFLVLLFTSVFMNLTDSQILVLEMWIPVLAGILTLMYAFYYTSRGIEKVTKIKNSPILKDGE